MHLVLGNRILRCNGRPEIFNSDQGAPFTSQAFTDLGGCCLDVGVHFKPRGLMGLP